MRELWLAADTEGALTALVEFLGLSDGAALLPGVSVVTHAPGSVYEEWPGSGSGTLNTYPWASVLVDAPTASDGAFWAALEAKQSDATDATKPSANGNQPSRWYEWTVTGGVGRMFRENGAGDGSPDRPRMHWAV